MDAGKTHTALSLIMGLRQQGFRVAAIKLTGTATGKDTWNQVSAYLLGPALNQLPVLLEPHRQARAAFAVPLVKVDATHALIVIAAYGAIFLAASVILSARRDVLE